MSEIYQPPFTMTEDITNLVIEIGEQVGAVAAYDSLQPNPTLRRENRIKSIHSSLAIEQNTLTLEQVSDIIDGKRVLGPPQDIREVKNAYEAYEQGRFHCGTGTGHRCCAGSQYLRPAVEH